MDEQKIIDLETRLAHQEHLLSALDDALSSQQAQISNLERLCRILHERIKVLSESGAGHEVGEDNPPHY